MFCKFCGKPIEDTAQVCPACGKEQRDLMPPPGLKRKQFYKKHFRCRRSLHLACILCYLAALLTLLAVDPSKLYWAFVDAGILLFFGGLMHLCRSRFAAVVLCLYGVFCLLTVFASGFLGWFALLTALLVLLAAVLGLRGTFCFARDWKKYCVHCGKVH